MVNQIRLSQKTSIISKKFKIIFQNPKNLLLILFFSLILHACSTNTTKSSEFQDNETKSESNDNSSVHVYIIDSPIRMSHEEIGVKRFGASYANPTDAGSFLSDYSAYLEFYNRYTYDG